MYIIHTHTHTHTHTPHLLKPMLCWWVRGLFHVLAILDSAAMNIGVYVSFRIRVFIFFRYTPRSEIAESYGSFIF